MALITSRRALLYTPPVVVAGGATTTWNPSDKNANVALSNGDLTVSRSSGTGDAGVRSVASTSTAKVYWETTVDAQVSGGGNCSPTGIANSSWALTWIGNAGSTGANGPTAGQVWSQALDATARKFWTRVDGGAWAPSGDPAAGTGGQDVSAITGAIFAANWVKATGDIFTTNFGASAYSYTPPSGFGNWS